MTEVHSFSCLQPAVEGAAQFQLSQQALADWHSYSEYHAGGWWGSHFAMVVSTLSPVLFFHSPSGTPFPPSGFFSFSPPSPQLLPLLPHPWPSQLWALLHFIMPSMFDSHEEFNEWFSRDIESHAEKKSVMDEHQLSRLHLILKPFMLRRIKRDVEHEMAEKVNSSNAMTLCM